MKDRGRATTNSEDQPIWVQDLIAWLKKIEGLNLTGDEWVARVQEVLAELPGQGLPEEFWQRVRERAETAEAVPEGIGVEPTLLSDKDIKDRTPIQEDLEAAQAMESEVFRGGALADVVFQLPASEPQLLQQALEVAQGIEDEIEKSQALISIAALMPFAERQSVIRQALEIAQEIQAKEEPWKKSEPSLSYSLARLASQLPVSEPQLLQQALEMAQDIQDEYYRSEALFDVAAQLPVTELQSLIQQAREMAQKIPDKYYQSKALLAVATHLPVTQRKSLLQQVRQMVPETKYDQTSKCELLLSVATQLPIAERHSLIQQALEIAQSAGSPPELREALNIVFTQLPDFTPELRQPLLDAAQKIPDKSYQIRALANLANKLPIAECQSSLQQLKDVAQKIPNPESRSLALAELANKLPIAECQSLLQQALKAAQEIQDEYYQSWVLVSVADQLPTSEPKLLQQALEMTQGLKFKEDRSRAIAAVAARLHASEPKKVLQLARDLEDKENRITALTNIAFKSTEFLILHCPPFLLSTALEIIPEGKNSADKARLLSALPPRLSPVLSPKALQLIQAEITHPSYQAETLGNLAPYLPTKSLSEALDLIQNHIPSYSYPATALCNLIPYLSPEQLKKALEIAEIRCCYPELLAQILHQAAIRLSTPTFIETAPTDSDRKDDLINRILDLTHQHLTAERAITNILSALAPSLDRDDRLKFIKDNLLPKLKSEFYLSQVLAALSTSPGGAEPVVIFAFYRFVESGLHRLALLLFKDYKILFKEIAEGLQQDRPKTTALSAFIPFYPELHNTITALIKDAPNSIRKIDLALILATCPHPKYLNYSANAQLAADQTNALRLVREQPRDVDKTNSIIKLAPHLLQNQILEAQSIALELQDRYHQARSLLALATHFPEIRAEAERQIAPLQAQDPIQHIELLSQFATTIPEHIPTLLNAIKDWSKANPFDSEGDRNTYKRRRILIALKPHLPIRLVREIDRETGIGKAPQDLWERALFVLRSEYRQALKMGSLRNDATQDEDLLNLKDEINALTEMLLMRDLDPPVTVGILGGWGGGKSYIMHLMQTHMVAIRSQGMEAIEAWGFKDEKSTSPDSDQVGRFVGHIYQIKFDAWTYAKANLWASLMQTIFFELDRQISLEQQIDAALKKANPNTTSLASQNGEIWQALYEVSDEDREWFLKNVLNENWNQSSQNQTSSDQLWTLFANSQAEAIQNLEEMKSDLGKKKGELQKKSAAILNDQTTDNALFDTVSKKAISILQRRLGKSFIEQIQKELTTKFKNIKDTNGDMTDFYDLVKDDIESVFAKKEAWMDLNFIKEFFIKNYLLILICLLLIFLAVYIPLEIAKSVANTLIAQIMTGITPLLAAIPIAQSTIKKGQTLYTQVKLEVSSFTQQLQKNIKHRIDTNPELIQLNQEIQRLEREVKVKSAAIPTNTYASLSDFVKDRVQKGGYQEHLGMMHQVKEDLTMLSKRLLPPPADSKEYNAKVKQLAKVFPRGSARVVLYIDDLDRCPPNTVVEVLEAVQLLVKNPLFIAVLAIDERYINRALAQHYKGVLSLQGSPSSSDYLEKIIQIPYRVRPIAEDALRAYLRAQTVVQDSETSGTKFNEFSPQEFNRLVACCQEVELSPRSLKRLTNVYKLYKILSRTRGQHPTPREQQAILTLLAFSSRYPDLMRGILQKIGSHYEEGRHHKEDDNETLVNTFVISLNKYETISEDNHLAQDAKKLLHDVTKLLVAYDLKLNEIHDIFTFVRTFSFVGDIGVDVAAYARGDHLEGK